jgi:hypothetical protein
MSIAFNIKHAQHDHVNKLLKPRANKNIPISGAVLDGMYFVEICCNLF